MSGVNSYTHFRAARRKYFDINKESTEKGRQINLTKGQVKVQCIENGKTYDSITKAAEDLNLNPVSLSQYIRKGKSLHGYSFKRLP